jgi:predicted dehydrogenase
MIRIGVIGCGHWGPNHVRVFSAQKGSRVVAACDQNPERLAAVSEMYPALHVTRDVDEIIKNPEIDAVIIATPSVTHYALTMRSLAAGKDVLCEKPLAVHPLECEEMVQLANERKRILMVGHVYLLNSGIHHIRSYIESQMLGEVIYAYSVRSNRGPIRADVSVVYDLAAHDVSVFNYLFDSTPVDVVGRGKSRQNNGIEDAAFLTLSYPGEILVNIHVSWLAMRKTRQITVVGDRRVAEWDELSDVGPVRLFERLPAVDNISYKDFGEFQLLNRDSELQVPHILTGEPLAIQARHFLECVQLRKQPICDGQRATDVVRTLWAATEALKSGVAQSIK